MGNDYAYARRLLPRALHQTLGKTVVIIARSNYRAGEVSCGLARVAVIVSSCGGVTGHASAGSRDACLGSGMTRRVSYCGHSSENAPAVGELM